MNSWPSAAPRPRVRSEEHGHKRRARPAGLSLGDRACLALARRLGLPVLSADRTWLKVDVGVAVEFIRPSA